MTTRELVDPAVLSEPGTVAVKDAGDSSVITDQVIRGTFEMLEPGANGRRRMYVRAVTVGGEVKHYFEATAVSVEDVSIDAFAQRRIVTSDTPRGGNVATAKRA